MSILKDLAVRGEEGSGGDSGEKYYRIKNGNKGTYSKIIGAYLTALNQIIFCSAITLQAKKISWINWRNGQVEGGTDGQN